MVEKNDELLRKLLAIFRVEAGEHLGAISSGLIALEKAPAGGTRAEIVERVFREAHSLKGAARAVNLTGIESVCQSLEGVLAAVKGGSLAATPPLFDLLHQAVDALGAALTGDAGAPTGPAPRPALTALVGRLDDALKGPPPGAGLPSPAEAGFAKAGAPAAREARAGPGMAEPATAGAPPAFSAPALASGTVRVSVGRLDALMRQAEELLWPRLAAAERAAELREMSAQMSAWRKRRERIRPAVRDVERSAAARNASGAAARGLPKVLEYLDGEEGFVKAVEDRLARLTRAVEQDRRGLSGMTDGVLQAVREMQLMPASSLLDFAPRFVRDLARDQGKEVDLAVEGGEIEIDRRILEEMRDPLIHLLRNSIDHGIETPAVRRAGGKPATGTITIAISHKEGGKVEILVADDGAGIDSAKVAAVARDRGLLPAEETAGLGDAEAAAIVFLSGLSTSSIITDVSGRGLGLAIVREKTERLGGTVAIESRPGRGAAFRIVLPLTLATLRGVLVRAGEHPFVIPATGIERVTRVARNDIRTVENRDTIALDGEAVSLVQLADVLEMPRTGAAEGAGERVPAVVLGHGRSRIAFQVEEIIGEQEVLVKTLGRQLARVRNVAGASVLGTGQVVPVLNVFDLLKSAARRAPAPAPARAEGPAEEAPRSILVVEDSITARTLLKSILESAGYRVATAVDGIDGFTALKTAPFDLVVSDVEMPRMDGFDLTARVRADKQLAELPIVLVTALESREHRERGIDVGANAYIVKSSFDQSNLLDVVRRLL